jgi:ABC-type histidine transport system ATPase subunit
VDEPIISVRDLTVRHGDQCVLDRVNLDIARGEVMVLLGGSGSGKTTMLRHIIGLERPDEGLANRNKQGLAVHLKSPHAREILERLVKWADVLVINFPHPVRKRLKLTYEDVAPWNSRLIYADITGYGDDGPDADLPGFVMPRSSRCTIERIRRTPPSMCIRPPMATGF